MEIMANTCVQDGCIVHVWIVDQASIALEQQQQQHLQSDIYNENTVFWLDEVQTILEKSRYCLHHVPSTFVSMGETINTDHLIGPNCELPSPPKPCHTERKHTTTKSSTTARTSAQQLRQWLASPLATQQLPAHVSDAWRLVALAEYGGLYLDADVFPLSPYHMLRLPLPSIPTQIKISAYRLNGGVLTMEALPTASHTCDEDDDVDDNDKKTLQQHQDHSFLHEMIIDHLYWAPRLARLPLDQQTFGFLGPCALTRTYLSRRYDQVLNNTPTILRRDMVEGTISPSTVCQDND
jgi:hypothetical protein